MAYGMRGDVLSYALNNRVFACGHQAVTIAGGGGNAGNIQVDVSGLKKTTDTILITIDLNGQSISLNAPPYILTITDNSHFVVDGNLWENPGGSAVTMFLNWAVLR